MITGRILRTEESTDGRQNIKIIVEFSEDGKVIVPEWTLWAQFRNFIGLTAAEIAEWIRINIESQIGNLIQAKAKTALNSEFIAAIDKLKAMTFQTDKVEIPMAPSQVIDTAYKVILNSDGTYTVVR